MKRVIDRLGWGLAGALGIAVVAILGGVVSAGPLAPPGPPASTQETLIYQPASCAEFPIVLNARGSYKLASNVVMPAACAKNGIQIAVDNVTIDLNGFELRGVPGSLDGITDNGGPSNGHTIKNGVIKQWGARGVDGSNLIRVNIDSVQAIQNGAEGFVLSLNARVTNCGAYANGSTGVSLQAGAIIDTCIADSNGLHGLEVSDAPFLQEGALVTNCVATNNAGVGIRVTASGSTVLECSSSDNAQDGIYVVQNSDIRDNEAFSNGFDGIFVASGGNRIEGNHIALNTARGITVAAASGNVVIRNTARGNIGGAFTIPIGNLVGTIVAAPGAMNGAANDLVNIDVP